MKQFTIITKDGSKWLRPTDVLSDVFNVIYLGSAGPGTVLSEEQVIAITQARNKEYSSANWFSISENDADWNDFETRTAYTDTESHDRHIRPFKTHNVRPLVNQLVREEISFSRFIELLNEIANTH